MALYHMRTYCMSAASEKSEGAMRPVSMQTAGQHNQLHGRSTSSYQKPRQLHFPRPPFAPVILPGDSVNSNHTGSSGLGPS